MTPIPISSLLRKELQRTAAIVCFDQITSGPAMNRKDQEIRMHELFHGDELKGVSSQANKNINAYGKKK